MKTRSVLSAAILCLVSSPPSRGTVLTFEDFTANNSNLSAAANPFGAGQYGSRAASAVNAGFQEGDGWTPGVTLTWAVGWHTYTGWPFGNNDQTAGGRVAQADYDASGGAPLTITFTPDAGLGVLLQSFAFTVWDSSPELPVQVRWTIYGGAVGAGNVLATGTTDAIGATGGAQTIDSGLTTAHSAGAPVILQWERLSGDGTYIAINNIRFRQTAALIAPVLTWAAPDAIVDGTALSDTQLNAQSNVPGSFNYTPAAGAVLTAGVHTLSADFTPTDTAMYSSGTVTASLRVKADNVPVVTVTAPRKIAQGTPLDAGLFDTSADVQGAFTLSPPFGTVLVLGSHSVTATFTPVNSVFQSLDVMVPLEVVASVPEGTLWTFDDPANRLRADCGSGMLTPYDPAATDWAATKLTYGSASGFGLPLPAGGDPQVMRFAHTLPAEGLKLEFDEPPNGVFINNGRLSNYTLIFDLLYPAASGGTLRPLFNASPANTNDAEAAITTATPSRVQTATGSFGEIKAGTWHRVAIVIRSSTAEGQSHIYIDGTFIGAVGSNDNIISARYSLLNSFLLLTANTGHGGAGFLSGLRFIGRNLDDSEVRALGGVHAAGPHAAGPPAPRPPYQPQRDIINIGHRGNGGLAPEDTLPSFLECFAEGGDVVEVDCRRTSDSRVVVMHDSTVDRVTDGTGAVASKTLAQLQALDSGSWFGPQYAGTHPSSLRELMAAVKDAWPQGILYLDLKLAGMAPLVRADADATGFPTERLWFWVYESTSDAAAYRTAFPGAKIIWGEGNWSNGASIGSWPGLSAAAKQTVADGMKARGVYGFDFGDNEMTSLNPATLQELRAAGFLVSAYSALHPRSMNSAIEHLGVDAMETDFPGALRELMPHYTANAAAAAFSDAAAGITWSAFPGEPALVRIKVRAKRKAAAPSTWSVVADNLPPRARSATASSLAAATLYEFQPIGYDAADKPVAFGSVTEAMTLAAGQNFAAAWAAWVAGFPAIGAPDDDPDVDGLTNFMEYAAGRHPLTPDIIVPEFRGPSTIRHMRATGRFVRWDCEASDDLNAWTTLLPLSDYQEMTVATDAGVETIDYVLSPTGPAPIRRFVRLRAAAGP